MVKKSRGRDREEDSGEHTHIHSLSISSQEQSCRVIEQHSDAGITQLVAETILVTVVHPLAHPEDGHGGRVLCIICQQLRHKNMDSSVHTYYRYAHLPNSSFPISSMLTKWEVDQLGIDRVGINRVHM